MDHTASHGQFTQTEVAGAEIGQTRRALPIRLRPGTARSKGEFALDSYREHSDGHHRPGSGTCSIGASRTCLCVLRSGVCALGLGVPTRRSRPGLVRAPLPPLRRVVRAALEVAFTGRSGGRRAPWSRRSRGCRSDRGLDYFASMRIRNLENGGEPRMNTDRHGYNQVTRMWAVAWKVNCCGYPEFLPSLRNLCSTGVERRFDLGARPVGARAVR